MKVVVIGAGISGLASAWRIQHAYPEVSVTVLEAGPTPGGKIQTRVEDGWVLEAGPNGFLDNKPATLALIEDLGLSDVLLPADHASKRRFLFVDGRLQPLPTSPPKFLTSSVLPLGARLRVLTEPWRKVGPDDETLAEFGGRRLGPKAVERLLDPMVTGVFAGDVHQLSVKSAFPAVKKLEQDYGSLIRGMMAKKKERAKTAGGATGPTGHLHSFERGVGQLIARLAADLEVRLETPVQAITREGEGYRVHLKDDHLDADVVISAAPGPAAATYLEPLDPELAAPLRTTAYASVAVVAIGLKKSDLNRDLDGFGYLIPSREDRRILGCLWTSSIYPGHRAPEDHVLLRTLVGGAHHPELVDLSDEALVDLVREEHAATMGLLWETPAHVHIDRWSQAIPQYAVGHSDRIAAMEARLAERWPGLLVTGNHLHGISMNDCTADAERVLAAFAELRENKPS